MTCTKTDFRTYQPFQGQPELICWTCGVAKDRHYQDKPKGLESGIALEMQDEIQASGLKAYLASSVMDLMYKKLSDYNLNYGKDPSYFYISFRDYNKLTDELKNHKYPGTGTVHGPFIGANDSGVRVFGIKVIPTVLYEGDILCN